MKNYQEILQHLQENTFIPLNDIKPPQNNEPIFLAFDEGDKGIFIPDMVFYVGSDKYNEYASEATHWFPALHPGSWQHFTAPVDLSI